MSGLNYEQPRRLDHGDQGGEPAARPFLAGHGVLLISSDLPEVVGMSDRVLVMSRGTVVAELSGELQTEREVLQAAAGLVGDVTGDVQ